MSRGQEVTITNDGATILKAIYVDNPAAKVLVGTLLSMTFACRALCPWWGSTGRDQGDRENGGSTVTPGLQQLARKVSRRPDRAAVQWQQEREQEREQEQKQHRQRGDVGWRSRRVVEGVCTAWGEARRLRCGHGGSAHCLARATLSCGAEARTQVWTPGVPGAVAEPWRGRTPQGRGVLGLRSGGMQPRKPRHAACARRRLQWRVFGQQHAVSGSSEWHELEQGTACS